MIWRTWSIWQRLAAALVALAIAGALVAGAGRLAWSLVARLAISLAAWRGGKGFHHWSTPIRVSWTIAVLATLWLVLYLALLPAADSLAGAYPQLALAEPVAGALKPLVELDGYRRLYLALAVTVPLLLFAFGAGPFSQNGLMAAPPTRACAGPPTGRPPTPIDAVAPASGEEG